MLGKVPSIPFKASDSLDRTPSNQSYNATLKHYHNEIHKILSAALTEDERSKLDGESQFMSHCDDLHRTRSKPL